MRCSQKYYLKIVAYYILFLAHEDNQILPVSKKSQFAILRALKIYRLSRIRVTMGDVLFKDTANQI
tara:strand:+ start:786 stop:983 length:198 start_codon:yes stop_codon:yes gene_type:complete